MITIDPPLSAGFMVIDGALARSSNALCCSLLIKFQNLFSLFFRWSFKSFVMLLINFSEPSLQSFLTESGFQSDFYLINLGLTFHHQWSHDFSGLS